MADFIQSDGNSSIKGEIITPIYETSMDREIYLVHPALGLSLIYARLIRHFKEINIYGIDSPALWLADYRFDSIADIATLYCKKIMQHASKNQCYIEGWSSGGNIAFEMALQFEKAGFPIEKVILIDSFNTLQPSISQNDIMDVNSEVRRQGVDPESDLGKRLCQQIANTLSALIAYQPSHYAGDAVLIRGKDNDSFNNLPQLGFDNGWSSSLSSLEVIEIPGSHHYLFEEQYIKSLARALSVAVLRGMDAI